MGLQDIFISLSDQSVQGFVQGVDGLPRPCWPGGILWEVLVYRAFAL